MSLDSVVIAFLRGESPEGISESFPALNLERIFGTLTYYLANREAMDAYLDASQKRFEELRKEARSANPSLYARLDKTIEKSQTPQS